jgi:hypothetical protein
MVSAVEYLIEVATKAKFTRLVRLLDEVRAELNLASAAPDKSKRGRKVLNPKRTPAN